MFMSPTQHGIWNTIQQHGRFFADGLTAGEQRELRELVEARVIALKDGAYVDARNV